jgi:hypothetical protein
MAARFTAGDWKTSHFDALENDGTGTLVAAGYKKRVISAVRFDKQNRRCTQFLAEVHEQAGLPEQGAANAELMADAQRLLNALEDMCVGFGNATPHPAMTETAGDVMARACELVKRHRD